MWLAIRDHGPAAGLALRRWWSDRAGWQEWQPPAHGYGTRIRRLTPDVALLVDVVGTAAAFVEVDPATMASPFMVTAYTRHGYELITLPKTGVATRLAFIQHRACFWATPRSWSPCQ